jgi:hypothetical protein
MFDSCWGRKEEVRSEKKGKAGLAPAAQQNAVLRSEKGKAGFTPAAQQTRRVCVVQ